jgi:lycopene beta-cyclase
MDEHSNDDRDRIDHDLILVGGGLANSLIAWRLHTERPELRILLLEQGRHLGGNHTWSFHDSDLTAGQLRWIAPLVSHRWPGYNVVFPEHARALSGGYASIASPDFARTIEAALGPLLRTGVRIDAARPRACGWPTARCCMRMPSSMGAAPAPARIWRWATRPFWARKCACTRHTA